MGERGDPRIALAWENNADLYEIVFNANGLRYWREERAFVAMDPPPPYYSDLSLLPRADTSDALDAIRTRLMRNPDPFSVKDGNNRLDLAPLGFRVLFDASWVRADADAISHADEGWMRIETSPALEHWETAWNRGGSPADRRIFVPDILNDPRIAIFGRADGEGFLAGFIANRSSDCVGLSNLFGRPDSEVIATAAALSSDFGDGLPVVSYSSGDELTAMMRYGFKELGPLRIWIKDL